MKITKILFIPLFFVLILGAGCKAITPAPTPEPLPTPVPTDPGEPMPITPTPPEPPKQTDEQTSEQPSQAGFVKIFLIAPEDNGKTGKKIGCEDSVIGVNTDVGATTTPLKAALEALLATKNPYGESGLFTTLNSEGTKLTLKSAAITDGHATVHLTGELSIPGVCQLPRIQAQLEETALQFPTVKSVSFFINDKPLKEILSQK